MAIKKYFATKDNTITNAFKANLSTRGVSGNMGQSDVLETFYIFAQANTSSSELARILVQFDSDTISTDRTEGIIPDSGSVSFYLRLYNAEHVGTTPKDFTLIASAVSGAWEEGLGLDMEEYSDKDASNWLYASDTDSAATATIVGTAALNDSDGDDFILRNADGSTVEFNTDPAKSFDDTVPQTESPFVLNTLNIDGGSEVRKATQACWIACKQAIDEGALNMTISPTSWGDEEEFTLTQNTAGTVGNTAITLITGVTANGETAFTGGGTGGAAYISWTTEGGDVYDDASSSFSQSFDTGFENLEIDVTPLMEQWISSSANSKVAFDMGERTNDGFRVSLSGSDETGDNSYYNKKFFARGSQFFFKRPTIEARWDSSKKDNRGNFYLSSSLVPASDNLMKLYLYNVVRGQLTNIPGVDTGGLLVSLYSGTLDNIAPSGSKIGLALGGGTAAALDTNTTASYVETGIYSCSFAYTSSAITTIFDVWHSGSTATEYHTGSSISIDTFDSQNFNFNQRYVSKITNLRANYSTGEVARFRLFTRLKDWNPTIYTVAKNDVTISIVDNIYYKIVRANDDWVAVDFGTGSTNCTRLSYDASGSYFDFDMAMLKENSVYQIYFSYLINGNYVEQPEVFRFRTT